MTYHHLIMIPFTGVGLYRGYRGDEWYNERIGVFKKTTLKSLANQKNQNFVVWFTFRPEEATNNLTAEIAKATQEAGVQYIMTFNGLMYTDDKFVGGWKNRYWNIRRVARGCTKQGKSVKDALPNILELFRDRNRDLVQRLEKSLAVIEKNIGRGDLVYLTRLDSDDMLHEDATEEIQNRYEEAIVLNGGYVYNADTGEIAEWDPTTSPPFFTLVFDAKTFYNPLLHYVHWRGYQSHEDIERRFKCAYITDRLYCVGVRDPKNHISTTWNHPFRGRTVGIARKRVLKTFGLEA